ncbi:thiamine-phosphate kinase [Bacillus suaedaesalsae]|uniref:Thiamine-monophosphate kinase n=1 Tax=Bacillus suaedaesalsae TaxID=2810349 RepID=A0ABS2DJK4_9BACI|nr:thiamine-phosphate kinase [Bacillus suaedaesalsae]MBM6618644.1 thiamine-phosphate kinase [Bacillus suaedaesalsae]
MGIKDEFDFINKISSNQQIPKSVIEGIGDDAAIIRPHHKMDTVVCKDTMVEGVHFKRETMKPHHIGHKALASNISDIAAMGGIPTFYLVSIAIPSTWQEQELLDIYCGMSELANQYEMTLIGGDTVSIEGPLVVTVTVLGEIEQGKVLKRSNAKPGDFVFLTGNVGDSAAGLHILLSDNTSNRKHTNLLNRHQLPSPQVKAGRILKGLPRASANDISDGVASEAIEIATASQVNIVIDEYAIPLSEEILSFGRKEAIQWALYGGEDYELLGTVSPENWDQLLLEFNKENIRITHIGNVVRGTGRVFLNNNGESIELKKAGYNHFG